GEGQSQVVAQVSTRGDARRSPRPGRRCATEEGVKQVAKRAKTLEWVWSGALVDAGPAEHVVGLPLLRVGQHAVSLVDLLEPLIGAGFRVDVRMPLLGQLAEGALYICVRGAARHAKNVVIVTGTCHLLAASIGRLTVCP